MSDAPPGTAAALSLFLRQAARRYLGLDEGDYWPSDVAAAQAHALIESGWHVTPPPPDSPTTPPTDAAEAAGDEDR